MPNVSPNRRTVLTGAGAVVGGLAGTSLLAACGGEASGPAPASTGGSNAGSGGGPNNALTTLSAIPDGSTIAVQNPQGGTVLLTRAGSTVTGLDAKCTHQGCTVAPKGAVLECPCHASAFEPGTGAVLTGPADAPLAKVAVTVTGDQVTLA